METRPAASTCHRIALRTINSGDHYLAKVERLHRVSRERFREKAWWGVVRTVMSSSEFDALQPRLYRLAPETIAIARAVLVEGESQSFVAERFNTTRQRVHGIVQRVEAAANNVPAGWRKLELWLPPKVARCIEALAAKALAEWKQGRMGTNGI